MQEFLTREMLEFLVMVSNYLMALCMGFYTLDCFWVFKYKNEQNGGFLYLRQGFWLFAIQLISFFNLAYVSKDWAYVLLYIALQVFFFIVLVLTPVIYRRINRLLLNNMCMLLGIGFITISRLAVEKAWRQFEIVVIAYIICMFVPILVCKLKFLQKLTWVYAVTGAFLLGIVLFLSESTYGSKLNFTIEGLTFQPSEIVKILFVLFLAGALAQSTSLLQILISSVLAGIHVLMLVLSTDLGGALIFFVAYLAMLFVGSRNYLYLLLGVAGGCGASVMAYQLFSHVRTRVLAWTDPWSYIDNQGYQITQSLFAIGSGSWFGMGLYKGNPDDIPFVEDDFIFSSICEEFGTIFGICLVLVILSCFIMMIKIALKSKNMFYRLAAFGFAIVYIFQVFLTIGGGIKFIPLTGVTLPFISYGGSSVATMMLMFFLLHGIYMIALKEQELCMESAEDTQETYASAEESSTVPDVSKETTAEDIQELDVIDLDIVNEALSQEEEEYHEENEEDTECEG